MSEDHVTRRILRFLKLMHGAADDERIRQTAIDKAWLTPDGAPTPAGVELARSFEDIERASSLG